MKATVPLGRWFGVPVGLHYSWFVIAWLIVWSLAGQFGAENPTWGPTGVWILAGATAALFFVCIVLHELAHATVARLGGMPVRGITLFALGGVALIERDAATPGREFWMAIAGPIASYALGAVCFAVARTAGWNGGTGTPTALAALFGWLAYINVALATFNLIPGFPLDGGRVLRSLIWAWSHDGPRATRIAARFGQAIGIFFIVAGVYSAMSRSDFSGLWIAFIGWFLLESAQANYAQARVAATLDGVRVADVMLRDCVMVDAGRPLDAFVRDDLLRMPGRCFVVEADGRTVGVISADDVRRLAAGRRGESTVADAMQPLATLHAVTPDAPATDALSVMGRDDVSQVPVVAHGRVEGVVTRSHLVRLLRRRRELPA